MQVGPSGSRGRRAPARCARRLAAAFALLPLCVPDALAQAPTPDPSAWRPFAYADLRHPTAAVATYADLWKGSVEANGASPARDVVRRAADAAPVTEAHYVVWSAGRSAVLSILDTAAGCALKEPRPAIGVTVRLCPMRVAIYEGVQVRAFDAGRGCIVERVLSAGPDTPTSERAGAYASYDVASRTIRIGLVVDHRPVEGCSLSIPLRPKALERNRNRP